MPHSDPTAPTVAFDEERLIRALKANPSVRNPFAVAEAIKKRQAFAETDITDELVRDIAQETGEPALTADAMRAILRTPSSPALSVNRINADGFSSGRFDLFSAEPDRPIPTPDGGTRPPYTADRLRAVAANFGPEGRVAKALGAAHTPPVVVGHGEDQEWLERADLARAAKIEDVVFDEDRQMLVAVFSEMHPTAREWIEQGTFPDRSAEFHRDFHGLGPHLRRVALVGGQIPAKHDLAGTIFFNAEPEGDTDVVKFADDAPASLTTGIRPLRKKRVPDVDANQEDGMPDERKPEMTDEMAENQRLGGMIRAAIEEKTGDDEQKRAELLQRIATRAGITPSTVGQIVRGEIASPPIERLRAIARALDLSLEGLKEATPADEDAQETDENQEGDDDDERRPDDMQEQEDEMPEPKKTEKVDKNAGITPERFAEQGARLDKLTKQFGVQGAALEQANAKIAALEQAKDAAERTAAAARWDSFGEKLHASGQASGPMLKEIVSTLKKIDGVDKFSEGQAQGADAVAALLEKHLPRVDTSGAVISARTPADDKFSELKSRHAEYLAYNSNDPDPLSLPDFAEAEGIDKDAFAELKATYDKAVAS